MKKMPRWAAGLVALGYAGCAWASGDPAVLYVLAAQAASCLFAIGWVMVAERPWRRKMLPATWIVCTIAALVGLSEIPDYQSRHGWIDSVSMLACLVMLFAVRRAMRRH